MRTRRDLKNELLEMKKSLAELQSKEAEIKGLIAEKEKADKTGDHLFTLLKYMMQENKDIKALLQNLSQKVDKFEEELNADFVEEVQPAGAQQDDLVTEVNVSGLDAKILQTMQIKGMVCADDIKTLMNYRGRNAATQRLHRLFRQGLIERHQLGHKVYYKYNAGKTTKNTLIVSPPQ